MTSPLFGRHFVIDAARSLAGKCLYRCISRETEASVYSYNATEPSLFGNYATELSLYGDYTTLIALMIDQSLCDPCEMRFANHEAID